MKTIDFSSLDSSQLTREERQKAANDWFHRMKQEHLAVYAFSKLSCELAAEETDEVVLELVTRAASDEIRHAIICRKLGNAILGRADEPTRFRGVPNLPPHEDVHSATRVLLHVAEMCCIGETCTGIFLTELRARATDPVARAAVDALLRDEIDHGRVGWAYLAARARDATLRGLDVALPALLDRTVGRVLETKSTEATSPALASVAAMEIADAREIYRSALVDVILPGFDEVSVDTVAARAFARERGWI